MALSPTQDTVPAFQPSMHCRTNRPRCVGVAMQITPAGNHCHHHRCQENAEAHEFACHIPDIGSIAERLRTSEPDRTKRCA